MSNKNGDRVCDYCVYIWSMNSGEGIQCETCHHGWCSEECASEDGYILNSVASTCKYCRLEDATDTELLGYVMHHTGWSRSNLIMGWKYDKKMGVKY